MKKISIALVTLLASLSLFAQGKVETVKIKTSAVCEMCKYTIEKDMEFEKGIKTAELDVASKMSLITFNPQKKPTSINCEKPLPR